MAPACWPASPLVVKIQSSDAEAARSVCRAVEILDWQVPVGGRGLATGCQAGVWVPGRSGPPKCGHHVAD